MASNPLAFLLGRLRRRMSPGYVDPGPLGDLARPHDPADYEIPELDGSGPKAADIPLDHTKPDASWNVWAPRTRSAPAASSPALVGAAFASSHRLGYSPRLELRLEPPAARRLVPIPERSHC